jgi:hypothetical protein
MVGAFDTTLAISVKMAYDYDYLKSAGAASGVTPESLKAKMQVMCVEGLFLRKGG